MSIESIKRILLENGINPSFQRLKIYDFLITNPCHPTVDMIYNKLIEEIPTLSKTTIYNTLNLFQNKGIVIGLTIDENEVRYESNLNPHAHFKCTLCNCIYDIPIEYPQMNADSIDGHRITEKHLYLKGICRNCQEKKKNLF
jgi:Fe2+ or Zn2+ uptake regulation protein